MSKCYVVYLRHIVFDSDYFTGEFIDYTDYTDNIISFTVGFINMFIKLLHSSSLSQFSYVTVIP